jgi:two-component system cell cycle response regulator CpdR
MRSGPMRVLVVDDEGMLRRTVARLLPGVDVVVAEDAVQALAILRTQHLDVVLTDHHMPDYTGLQLLLDVAGTYPGIRRVLMSGLPECLFDEHLASQLVHCVLSKPFDRGDLRRAVGERESIV